MTAGKQLKAWRVNEAGITAKQLAERLGVTERTVWRYEAGDVQPPLEMILTLRELAGIEVEAWRA